MCFSTELGLLKHTWVADSRRVSSLRTCCGGFQWNGKPRVIASAHNLGVVVPNPPPHHSVRVTPSLILLDRRLNGLFSGKPTLSTAA